MIAVAVKVLVIDAIRNSVESSAARRDATSAKPGCADQTSPLSWTTPAARPGSRFSRTNAVAVASSSFATESIGFAIGTPYRFDRAGAGKLRQSTGDRAPTARRAAPRGARGDLQATGAPEPRSRGREFFGESGALDPGPGYTLARSATVTAREPTDLGVMGERDFSSLIHSSQPFRELVYAQLAEVAERAAC
jgi:hypothetical protein